MCYPVYLHFTHPQGCIPYRNNFKEKSHHMRENVIAIIIVIVRN